MVVIAAGMALIAKGLVQASSLAMTAYCLVAAILEAPKQTSEQDAILKLLADMQGVRRLSNLLCPTLGLQHAHLGHLPHTCKPCLCPHLHTVCFLLLSDLAFASPFVSGV